VIPPRKADVGCPAQRHVEIGHCAGAVKRGSTWMIFAAARLGLHHHWNPTGWHSAMFEPWMTITVRMLQVLLDVVAPPVRARCQTGHRGAVSDPGLVFDLHDPSAV